jgi:uncharacterized membrane protein
MDRGSIRVFNSQTLEGVKLIIMRVVWGTFLFVFLLASAPLLSAFSADYTPTSLTATIYVDGVVGIEYNVDVNPTAVRVTIPLFGSNFPDLLVVNQDGLPLAATQSGSSVTVDSLGSTVLTLTYSNQDLTTKVGTLWSLNVTSPTNLVTILPAGATIVSLSQVPLDVGTVNGRTQITLPPGPDSVSYVVSTAGTKEHAQSVIQNAETTINATKVKGVITTDADTQLAQSKVAFDAANYLTAEQLATQAKTSAIEADLEAQAANTAIQRASTAIQTAKSAGRTLNTEAADGLLNDAQGYYSTGDYARAKTSADEAYTTATTSRAAGDNTILIAGFAVAAVIVAAVIVVFMRRRGAAPKPTLPPPRRGDEPPVNLEAVFRRNSDLRVDDKEVLRFLGERGGEAFANEIRDRFDIPRTSAWRMIRRLIAAGIVEERKIGGQSLIYITKKYRGGQEA